MTVAAFVAAVTVGGTVAAAAVALWPTRHGRAVPPVPARAMRRLLEHDDAGSSGRDGTP